MKCKRRFWAKEIFKNIKEAYKYLIINLYSKSRRLITLSSPDFPLYVSGIFEAFYQCLRMFGKTQVCQHENSEKKIYDYLHLFKI